MTFRYYHINILGIFIKIYISSVAAAAAAGVVGWRLIFLGGRTVLGGGNSSASFLHLVTAAAGRKYFGSEAIFRARAPG